MENTYSKWLKIDLHIHSDFSKRTKDNDYKGIFDVDILKSRLIANSVSIFSITDHNIINIEAYKEYYSKYDSTTDPLLLLGVELDVEVVKRKAKTYHTLLVFNCSNSACVATINNKLEALYVSKGILDLKQRKVTIEDIASQFKEFEFFFIPHAYSDKNIVTAYKDGAITDAQKMVLLMSCGLEKVTTEETIEAYNSGFNTLLTENFQSKNDIPYINFSDNHNINKYPCRHIGENGDHEFYYIKGSKNFESIRLAFIDPQSRIKTSQQFNAINHINNTIDLLKIDETDLMKATELHFSPHLNVIIGGRSSGKSLLMWLLGKKINAEVKDNAYSKYSSDSVFVKSKNDASYSLSTSQNRYIYIKQGDIIDYFEKGRLSELAKKSNKTNEYTQNKQFLLQKKQEIETSITELVESYRSLYDFPISNKLILHDKSIQHILSSHYIIKFDKDHLKINTDISSKLKNIADVINSLNTNLEALLTHRPLLSLTEEQEELIAKFNKLLVDKEKLITNKEIINKQKIAFIVNVNEYIEHANSTLSQDARNKDVSIAELVNLNKDIVEIFKRSQHLRKQASTIGDVRPTINAKFDIGDGIKLVLDASTKETITELLKDGIRNVNDSISLFANLLGLLMQKNGLAIKNITGNHPDNLKKKFKTQLTSVLSAFDSPKDYLEYEDGETSKDKSPGYNSEKYLNIILNNPDVNIVIIDQPEDNLGNKFSAEELVKLIRGIKFKKQIFLVTHNPSVVVYGDAESVILAKNENNIINYTQIVLEDSKSQREICSILDGGEYIFNNRYKKYNIQRIIK